MNKPPDLQAELAKAWRLVTSPFRALPDFVLPGAPKCGTSSLYDCIASHPQVRRADRKEPTNFIHYPDSALRSRMHFPFEAEKSFGGAILTGEASVEYFTHPDAPKNVHGIVPRAKLIFLFRDPVARAWSDYQMFARSGHETEDFSVVMHRAMRWLSDPDAGPLISSSLRNAHGPLRYAANGLYRLQIARWLEHFDRKDCLFLVSEDFFKNPAAITAQVFGHLGLPAFDPPSASVARQGDYRETPDPQIREALQVFFAPHNRALAEFLGRELPW